MPLGLRLVYFARLHSVLVSFLFYSCFFTITHYNVFPRLASLTCDSTLRALSEHRL